MTMVSRGLLALVVISMVAATGCDAVTGGGPDKVVINERVCASVTFLRMTVGETHRVVLDASGGSADARSMSFRMDQFPVTVRGDVPPNSILGDQFSTITLTAASGDEASVDIVPTRSGTFKAVCGVVTGGRIVARDINVQILPS
jgi:hypothetical protein